MRIDLDYLERQISDKNVYWGMVPTWRYQHCMFPTTKLLGIGIQETMLKMDTGFKFSLDISIRPPLYLTSVEHTVKQAAYKYKNIKVVDRSRRSHGAQGSQDPLQA